MTRTCIMLLTITLTTVLVACQIGGPVAADALTRTTDDMTETRAHTRNVVLDASPERVFQLLISPSDIRAWWGASRAIVLPEQGGTWAAAWGDDEDEPDYVTTATISVYQPPNRFVMEDIRYSAKAGPLPFEAHFTIEFSIAPHPEGSLLTVHQGGFPACASADDFYKACEIGWINTLASMKRYVDSLKGRTSSAGSNSRHLVGSRSGGPMFLGLRTQKYHVDDLESAKAWYAELLGTGPYFDEPFYVGFNVGGLELGLLPREGKETARDPSAVAYWGVDDIEAALKRILSHGATPHEAIQDVGEGIKVATVHDPFGNTLGLIENPHFAVAQE